MNLVINDPFFRCARVLSVMLVTLLTGWSQAPSAYAGGVVTDYSSAADFIDKLNSGGLVSFDCGSNPPAILLPAVITITQDTVIDVGAVEYTPEEAAARLYLPMITR